MISGTIDASVDRLRIAFEDDCRPASYVLNGPLLRSNPARRVFALDESDCTFDTVQAIRAGKVVSTFEKPAPYRD